MKQYELDIIDISPEEMEKRVARFKTIKYPPNRYHDSQTPGNVRKNYLLVGRGLIAEGSIEPMSAIPVEEGFQLSYIKAEPGNGPSLHNHDTNETFTCLEGKWKIIWGKMPRIMSFLINTMYASYRRSCPAASSVWKRSPGRQKAYCLPPAKSS